MSLTANEIKILISARNDASSQLATVRKDLVSLGSASTQASNTLGSATYGTAQMKEASSQAAVLSTNLRQIVNMGLAITGAAAAFNILAAAFQKAKAGSTDYASMIQKAEMSWKTLLGEQNKSIEGFDYQAQAAGRAKVMMFELAEFAKATPFAFPEVQSGARRLLAMGFAATEVMGMMRDIGQVAAGMTLGNEGVQRITLALGQMNAKGKASGEELLQLTEAGIDVSSIMKVMAEQTGKTSAEISKLRENGKLSAREFIEAFSAWSDVRFGDALTNSMATMEGAMSTVNDAMSELLNQGLKPLMAGATNWASKLAEAMSTEEFTRWGFRVNAVVTYVMDSMHVLSSSFMSGFSSILDTVVNFGRAIYEGLQWINPFAQHSPDLVSQVNKGVNEILASYQKLGGTNTGLRSAADAIIEFKKGAVEGLAAVKAETDEANRSALENFGGGLAKAYEEASEKIAQFDPVLERSARNISEKSKVVKTMETAFDKVKDSLGKAKDALQKFTQAPISGTKEYDTKKFALEQQSLAIEKQMSDMRLSGVRETSRGYKDLEKSLTSVNEQAKNLGLEERLKFDPLRRQIEATAKPMRELPFSVIIAGIKDSQSSVGALEEQFDTMESTLGIEKSRLTDLKEAYAGVSEQVKNWKTELTEVTSTASKVLAEQIAEAKRAEAEAEAARKKAEAEAKKTGMVDKPRTPGDLDAQQKLMADKLKQYEDEAKAWVANLTAPIKPFTDAIEGMVSFLSSRMNSMKAAIEGNWFGRWVQIQVDYLKVKIPSITDTIYKGLSGMATKITTWLGESWAQIDWRAVWKTTGDIMGGLFTTVQGAGDRVRIWVNETWKTIKWPEVWNAVGDFFKPLFDSSPEAQNNLKAWIDNTWKVIKWTEVWATIGDFFSGLLTGITTARNQLLTWLRDDVFKDLDWTAIWKTTGDVIGGLIASVLTVALQITNWLKEDFKKIEWEGVWGEGDILGGLKKKLESIPDMIATALKNGINLFNNQGVSAYLKVITEFPAPSTPIPSAKSGRTDVLPDIILAGPLLPKRGRSTGGTDVLPEIIPAGPSLPERSKSTGETFELPDYVPPDRNAFQHNYEANVRNLLSVPKETEKPPEAASPMSMVGDFFGPGKSGDWGTVFGQLGLEVRKALVTTLTSNFAMAFVEIADGIKASEGSWAKIFSSIRIGLEKGRLELAKWKPEEMLVGLMGILGRSFEEANWNQIANEFGHLVGKTIVAGLWLALKIIELPGAVIGALLVNWKAVISFMIGALEEIIPFFRNHIIEILFAALEIIFMPAAWFEKIAGLMKKLPITKWIAEFVESIGTVKSTLKGVEIVVPEIKPPANVQTEVYNFVRKHFMGLPGSVQKSTNQLLDDIRKALINPEEVALAAKAAAKSTAKAIEMSLDDLAILESKAASQALKNFPNKIITDFKREILESKNGEIIVKEITTMMDKVGIAGKNMIDPAKWDELLRVNAADLASGAKKYSDLIAEFPDMVIKNIQKSINLGKNGDVVITEVRKFIDLNKKSLMDGLFSAAQEISVIYAREGARGLMTGGLHLLFRIPEAFVAATLSKVSIAWEALWAAVRTIWASSSLGKLTLVASGWDTISGFVTGMKEAGANFLYMVTTPFRNFYDAIKSYLKISSPSKLMSDLGGKTIEGFWQGIQDYASTFTSGIGGWIQKNFIDLVTTLIPGGIFVKLGFKALAGLLGAIPEKPKSTGPLSSVGEAKPEEETFNWSKIWEGTKENLELWKKNIEDWLTTTPPNIHKWITENKDKIGLKLEEWATEFNRKVAELSSGFEATVKKEWLPALTNWMDKESPVIATNLKAFLDSIGDWCKDPKNTGPLNKTAEAWAYQTTQWVLTGTAGLLAFLNSVSNFFKEDQNLKIMFNTGLTMGYHIARGIVTSALDFFGQIDWGKELTTGFQHFLLEGLPGDPIMQKAYASWLATADKSNEENRAKIKADADTKIKAREDADRVAKGTAAGIVPQHSPAPTTGEMGYALGNRVTNPQIALIGEAGPEWIIPENNVAKFFRMALDRGLVKPEGLPHFEDGGIIGASGEVIQLKEALDRDAYDLSSDISTEANLNRMILLGSQIKRMIEESPEVTEAGTLEEKNVKRSEILGNILPLLRQMGIGDLPNEPAEQMNPISKMVMEFVGLGQRITDYDDALKFNTQGREELPYQWNSRLIPETDVTSGYTFGPDMQTVLGQTVFKKGEEPLIQLYLDNARWLADNYRGLRSDMSSTAIHENAHVVETMNPIIGEMSALLRERKIDYGAARFPISYMGSSPEIFEGRLHTEIVSTGIAAALQPGVFSDREINAFWEDKDVPDYILGLLAAADIPQYAAGGILGNIPGLATGGIVNYPTIAQLGETGSEAVVPLRELPRILDSTSALKNLKYSSGSSFGSGASRQTISIKMADNIEVKNEADEDRMMGKFSELLTKTFTKSLAQNSPYPYGRRV